ncbi:uncharacterized protein BDZ99DRAFT_510880 [Mytilinidion resinicola]|uniref:AA9 family lytic polysaccharide monooxygenase n=1 Tax=Mytilinidion resinicola TaxID=574789 RepID=A0A6A6YBN4_9PEZI|nr:uncharacterized protein BDZ99DRAFT_510880 [Mytilinidion resinicola]KAF2805923.1 hypothetical protein BDZ99DRAFT_510880 [Mytilinidion resinicola]
MVLYLAFATIAALVTLASVHGGVGTHAMEGKEYAGWQPYNSADGQVSIEREYPGYNPLLLADLTTVNMRCNNPGLTGTGVSATVAAGDTIKAQWTQRTHSPASVLVYLAKCPAAGFPAFLAPGEHLIRHELIAVHQANNPQRPSRPPSPPYPPRIYKLTRQTNSLPRVRSTHHHRLRHRLSDSSYLVAFPGAYSASDPGLDFNIDAPSAMTATTYTIPGPSVRLGSGTGNGGAGTAGTGGAASSAAPTTLATAVKSSSAAAVASPAAACATVVKYGQCGASTHSGCTLYASGSMCTKSSGFYSQCL